MEVCGDIENLVIGHSSPMEQTMKVNWTSQILIIENTFIDYSKDINAKVAQVIERMPAPAADRNAPDAYDMEKIDLLRRQVESQERAFQASIEDKSNKLNETTKVAEEKKRVQIANANVKFSSLNKEINELSEQVNKVTEWENEEDLDYAKCQDKSDFNSWNSRNNTS